MSTLNPHICSERDWCQAGVGCSSDATEFSVKRMLRRWATSTREGTEWKMDKRNICTCTPLVCPSVPKGFSFLRRSFLSPFSRYRFILGELTCEKASLTEEHESRLRKPNKLQITSHVRLRCLTPEPSFKISQGFILCIKKKKKGDCSRALV